MEGRAHRIRLAEAHIATALHEFNSRRRFIRTLFTVMQFIDRSQRYSHLMALDEAEAGRRVVRGAKHPGIFRSPLPVGHAGAAGRRSARRGETGRRTEEGRRFLRRTLPASAAESADTTKKKQKKRESDKNGNHFLTLLAPRRPPSLLRLILKLKLNCKPDIVKTSLKSTCAYSDSSTKNCISKESKIGIPRISINIFFQY